MGMLRSVGYIIVLMPLSLIVALLLWVFLGQPEPGLQGQRLQYYSSCYLPPLFCLGFCIYLGRNSVNHET